MLARPGPQLREIELREPQRLGAPGGAGPGDVVAAAAGEALEVAVQEAVVVALDASVDVQPLGLGALGRRLEEEPGDEVAEG